MFLAHLVTDPVSTLLAFGIGSVVGFAAFYLFAQKQQDKP